MKELTNRVEKEVLKVWYIHSYISLVVLLILFFGYMILMFQFHMFLLLWLIALTPIIGFFKGRREARYSKYGMKERQLVLLNISFFTFRTILITRSHIQMLEYDQNLFQKRKDISSICVTIKREQCILFLI